MNVTKDGPDPVDIAVGARVRVLRNARGFSQSKLAEDIGVTFQQVQKYERGANRISISMLTRIAHSLGTTLPDLVNEERGENRPFDEFLGLLAEPGTAELLRAFRRVDSAGQRRAILELTRTLAGDAQSDD